MRATLTDWLRQKLIAGLIPEGRIGLNILGHRRYVGGMWDHMGRLQFDFMLAQGLQPNHCMLDVACGALRGGVRFIRYLDKGNYLGIDREQALIDIGIAKELGHDLFQRKQPEFVVSSAFEFHRFSHVPDLSLAQSLFSHLNSTDIALCLNRLREFVKPGHIFFATFFEGESKGNAARSSSLDHFEHTASEMKELGSNNGWEPKYLGDWQHPRDQMMMKYTAV